MPYPATEPYDTGLLDVGAGHRLAWEVVGRPAGRPAVVLHGGPGSGAPPWWRGLFDPERYRVALFDQRGCGRSTPHAGDDLRGLDHNTTADLIGDIERLRRHLGVESWLVVGGSWGSTLALAYAVAHPDRVDGLVLWAVVTTRRHEIDWFTHTMGQVYPEEFDALVSRLPAADRAGNIPLGYARLLRHPDPRECDAAARAWCAWEDRLTTLSGPVRPSARFDDPRFRLGFARLVTHYFGHHGFLPDDGITGRLDRIAHLEAYLLRGRLDIAGPLRTAYALARALPRARLEVIEGDAHQAGDDTVERVVTALDRFGAGRPLVG